MLICRGMIMDWVRILAYITGTVDQELLLRNEYLAAENRILKAQLKTPLRLTDAERMTLAEIAHRLGRKAVHGELPVYGELLIVRQWACEQARYTVTATK